MSSNKNSKQVKDALVNIINQLEPYSVTRLMKLGQTFELVPEFKDGKLVGYKLHSRRIT